MQQSVVANEPFPKGLETHLFNFISGFSRDDGVNNLTNIMSGLQFRNHRMQLFLDCGCYCYIRQELFINVHYYALKYIHYPAGTKIFTQLNASVAMLAKKHYCMINDQCSSGQL